MLVPRGSGEAYRPELAIDLRQFGDELPPPRGQFILSAVPQNTLTFLDNKTLAISMFIRNPHPGLSVRNKVFGGEYLFQTVFLDAESGKVIRTEQWSNASINCGLFFAPGGGFVVWHDFDLALHAPDGSITKTLVLDSTRFLRGASLNQSISGETIFAENGDRLGKYILRIRTEGLEQIGWSTFEEGYSEAAQSDSHFAFLTTRPTTFAPTHLLITDIGSQDSRSSAFVPKQILTTEGCLSVSFLDEQTLSTSGGCHELTIVSTSGNVLYKRTFDSLIGDVTPCRSCSVLVTGTYVMSRGSGLLDIPQKTIPKNIILLNWKTGDFVELPSPGTAKRSGATALSPNGCLWAMRIDTLLRIYRPCDSPVTAKLFAGFAQH